MPLPESTRQALETELSQLKSTSGNSISEIETLRSRITSLETSNREILAIVETKSNTNTQLLGELTQMQEKNASLSKKIATLEQSVQAEKAAATSAKWREQNLQQELNLTRQNNEWFEKELQTKRDEMMKTRKEKGARISELERQYEEQRSAVESLTRGEQQLRSRLKEAQDKVEAGLNKIQQLQEAAARTEESFRQDLESSRRLAELQVQQAETSKQRLKEVKNRLERVQDEFDEKKRRIEKQLEDEKAQHQKTFEKAQELQQQVSQFEATGSTQAGFGSRPQTPVNNGSQLRAGSPFGTPGSFRGKHLTATQALEELWKAKTELITVKKRNQQLSQELDDTMAILEAKVPELNGYELEIGRLRAENIQMTQLADESYQERDIAKKAARKAEGALSTAQSEVNILRAQLRDLGTQIQLLVFNIQAQEKGWDQLSQEEATRFEQLQRGEIAEGSLDDLSDTHRFITERFVAFKDIHELRAKNEELLRVTRELAERMESEEALAAKQQAVDNEREVLSLRETCSRLQDEIKSITVRMASHIKERDMFRRMAEGNRIVHEQPESPAGSQREVLASIEHNAMGEPEITTMLRELQSNFDNYRQESSIDRKAMREQVDKLSFEKNSLQAEVAKVRSQYDLAQERLTMLQSNYEALQNEKSELQKRGQSLSEAAARQDMRSQQLASDLVETKALLDSVMSKNANLTAEKELSTSIRDRLTQDNESLTQEKARLNASLSQVQSLMNERELSESETRRGLQEQIESLKAELSTTKRKLFEETDEGKKLQQRKEFENQQHQKRVDELVANLNAVKEELVAAKTSRDHLQARVDELTIELRTAQEKAERLQPRPTPRPGTSLEARTTDAETAAQIDELVNEITDLRHDLDLTKAHLESAQSQVEQYKEISSSAEESLSEITATQDQFRQQMEAELNAKDDQIKELQQRIEDVTRELSNSNSELNTLRDSQAEITHKFEDEKRILEEEVSRMKEDAERLNERAKYHQQDLRSQADIAKKAQQDYETELMRHAEAAKGLQALRAQFGKLQTDAASWKAEAESAKHTLDDNKRSFTEREQQLRQEVLELKERRRDVDQQNKLLQEQLNSFSAQLAAIKENRTAFMDTSDDSTTTISGSDTERLTELNKYLHREKEILEVQYNLKVREAERLQQQVAAKQSQLEDTQFRLEEERVARTDKSLAKSHEELMAKLNELNLIRESNTTLRAETTRLQQQLADSNQKLTELNAKFLPLNNENKTLEDAKERLTQELQQMTEDRDRWSKRVENIVNQQGRVDPTKVEEMKEHIAKAEAERDALKAKIEELETTAEAKKQQWDMARAKIIDQAKAKNRENATRISELTAEKDQLQTKLDNTIQQLNVLQGELETIVREKSALEQRVSELQQHVEAVSKETQQAPSADESTASADQLAQLQQQLESVNQGLTAANEAKVAADLEVVSLRSQLDVAVQERDAARAQAHIQTAAEAVPQLETQDVETRHAQNGVPAESQTTAPGMTDAERAELSQKLAQAEARVSELEAEVAELQNKVAETENHVKDTLEKRSQKMKEILNKKLSDDKAKNQAELAQEKDKLKAEYDLRLQQERKIWELEKGPSTTGGTNALPSTPVKSETQQPSQTPGAGVSAMLIADFSQLDDAETRQVLSSNTTLKQIVGNNLRNKVAVETKKIKEETEQALKTEYEAKIATAKDMEAKKSTLQINMRENKIKLTTAKLNVVETAAKETPERPVGEVWDMAKSAKPPPAPAAPPAASPAVAPPTPVKAPTVATGKPHALTPAFDFTEDADVSKGASAAPANGGTIQPAQSTPTSTTADAPANPFAGAQGTAPPPGGNPFAVSQQATTPAQQPAAQGQQPPGPARTGIPVANRGGAPRGGRGSSIPQRGGRGGNFQTRNASVGSLNPGATNFQPQAGNKRPSEAAEGGQNPKRQQRGGRGGSNRGGG